MRRTKIRKNGGKAKFTPINRETVEGPALNERVPDTPIRADEVISKASKQDKIIRSRRRKGTENSPVDWVIKLAWLRFLVSVIFTIIGSPAEPFLTHAENILRSLSSLAKAIKGRHEEDLLKDKPTKAGKRKNKD